MQRPTTSRSAACSWVGVGSVSQVAGLGQRLGDAPGGGDEEVPGPARGVAHGQREQRGLRVVGGGGLVEQGVQGGVEHQLDQGAGGVVGAGGLALVARGCCQGEGALDWVDAGVQLEQGLVDAAEFLGAEVAEVDRPQPGAALLPGGGQQPDDGQGGVVGQVCGVGDVQGAGLEQPAEPGQAQLGAAVLPAQAVEDDPGGLPQVGVPGADPAAGDPAQPGRGVVVGVAGAGGVVGGRVEQGVAVLGDEPEQQPVHGAQQGALQVRAGDLPGGELVAQVVVAGVAQEPGARGPRSPSSPGCAARPGRGCRSRWRGCASVPATGR